MGACPCQAWAPDGPSLEEGETWALSWEASTSGPWPAWGADARALVASLGLGAWGKAANVL